jgi:hypothetical protein
MGTRTLAQVVESARTLLQDNTGVYRYQDSELYRYISEALYEMRRIRPDLFIAYGLFTVIPAYDSSYSATVLPTPDTYFVSVVNYVAGRAELRDDEYTNDGRAAAVLAMFVNSLINGAYK